MMYSRENYVQVVVTASRVRYHGQRLAAIGRAREPILLHDQGVNLAA